MSADEAVVAVKDVVPKYFGNVLASFEQGCQLDLRVKLAIQFVSGGAVSESDHPTARGRAVFALDMAGAMVDEALARGLIAAMPDTDELGPGFRKHVGRAARANAAGQVRGQQLMREESGGVMPAGASIFPGGM